MLKFIDIVLCVCVLRLSLIECAIRVDARERARSVLRKRELDFDKRATMESDLILSELLELQESESMSVEENGKTVLGTKIDKMQEYFKGVPVFSGQVTVESETNGKLTGDVSGVFFQKIEDDLQDMPTSISKEHCLDVAIEHEGDGQYLDIITDVSVAESIYVDNSDIAHMTCFVQYLVETDDIQKRPTLIIDVETEEILLSWDNLDTFNCGERTYKSYGGNEKAGKIKYGDKPNCLDVEPVGDTCYLENKYVKVIDMNYSTVAHSEVASFQCKNGYEDEINGAYSPIVDAYFFGTMVGKMFEDWFSSTPLKEKIVLRVHFSIDYPNAFWNGRFCTFGDGSYDFYPFTTMDIVGHEIAHGVTEQGSGLIYQGEPGGINEAFSDIMGEALEMYAKSNADLVIGYEVMKHMEYMRSMEDPESDNSSIAHVSQMTKWMDPHYSSGIYRRVFYVVVEQKNVPLQNAVRVFLHANRLYWAPTSTFASAACDTVKAAYDLGYDTTPYVRAFDDVGIPPCNISTHIISLRHNRTYTDMTVSANIQPIFGIDIPGFVINVTIEAGSAMGDVQITVRNGTWELEDWNSEPENILAQDNNFVYFEPNEGLYYIKLSTNEDAEYNDVSLLLAGEI